MQKAKIGILSSGNIAHTMAKTVSAMQDVQLYAVASRQKQNAEEFAREFNVPNAYGSYEELAEDKNVELIYVASPHSHHFEHAMLCIEAGKPVLCEKSFTQDAAQAKTLLDTAKSKNIFIAEAIWTRYLPLMHTIVDTVDKGSLGNPRMLGASLGWNLSHIQRLFDPALAGGALLDLGVYPITLASMVFGPDIQSYSASAWLYHTGVDAIDSMNLKYADGKIATLSASFVNCLPDIWHIHGEDASMDIKGVTNPEFVRIVDNNGNLIEEIKRPMQISGYEYEVQACVDALREGKLECDEMPHSETLRVMQFMDDLRAMWGVRFPSEV